jgi:hypothetical protein
MDTVPRIPVRKLFWDALEFALEIQTRRLAKEIATSLGVPDAPLLQALQKGERIGAYLIEESGDDVDDLSEFRCQHRVPVGTAFERACGEPVVWTQQGQAEKRCARHTLQPAPFRADELSADRRVSPFEWDGETLYIHRGSNAIYREDGTLCGHRTENLKRACVFVVDETES